MEERFLKTKKMENCNRNVTNYLCSSNARKPIRNVLGVMKKQNSIKNHVYIFVLIKDGDKVGVSLKMVVSKRRTLKTYTYVGTQYKNLGNFN